MRSLTLRKIPDYDFNKHSVPLSFRVEHEDHARYKSLSSLKKKEVQYKFNLWLKKQLKVMSDE